LIRITRASLLLASLIPPFMLFKFVASYFLTLIFGSLLPAPAFPALSIFRYERANVAAGECGGC